MFGQKKPVRLSPGEYLHRFAALRKQWPDPFVDNAVSLQETLVISVGVLHAIFDRNGGQGWDEKSDQEYLANLREHLLAYASFTDDEKKSVEWSLEEILECGRELEAEGASGRDASRALDILKSRVVDWILAHVDEIRVKDEEKYLGHD